MARKAKTPEPRKRRAHPLEVKVRVLQELRAGTSLGDVCRAFGLAPTTVSLWRQIASKGGYEALFPTSRTRSGRSS